MTSRWLKTIGVMVIAYGTIHAAPPAAAAGNHSLDAARKNRIGPSLRGSKHEASIHQNPAAGRALLIGTPKNLRLRRPSPAIIGGGPSSNAKTTASINGTGMNRKW